MSNSWQRTQKRNDQIVYQSDTADRQQLQVYLENPIDNTILLSWDQTNQQEQSVYMPLTGWEVPWDAMQDGDLQEQSLTSHSTVRYHCVIERVNGELTLQDYDTIRNVTNRFVCPRDAEQLFLKDFPSLTIAGHRTWQRYNITRNSFHEQNLAVLLAPRSTWTKEHPSWRPS